MHNAYSTARITPQSTQWFYTKRDAEYLKDIEQDRISSPNIVCVLCVIGVLNIRAILTSTSPIWKPMCVSSKILT